MDSNERIDDITHLPENRLERLIVFGPAPKLMQLPVTPDAERYFESRNKMHSLAVATSTAPLGSSVFAVDQIALIRSEFAIILFSTAFFLLSFASIIRYCQMRHSNRLLSRIMYVRMLTKEPGMIRSFHENASYASASSVFTLCGYSIIVLLVFLAAWAGQLNS